MQGASALNTLSTDLLYHKLSITVDFESRGLHGVSTLWVRQWRHRQEASGTKREVLKQNLHCRQCVVEKVKVNEKEATFEQLDPLLGVAPKGTRDAETFDLLYRSALWTAAGDDTGELCIKVPTAAMDIVPDPPERLPHNAPPSARARECGLAGLLQEAKKNKCGDDYPTQQGYIAHFLKVEVTYSLIEPQTGLVWKHPGNCSAATNLDPHCYTTFSPAGADVDGPRCWFPCLDHTAAACIFELELHIIDTSGVNVDGGAVHPLTPLFSGETLPRQTPGGPYHYCTRLPTTARGVGLAIGRFKRHSFAADVVSQSNAIGSGRRSSLSCPRPSTLSRQDSARSFSAPPRRSSISRQEPTSALFSFSEISAYFLPEGYGGWLGLCKGEELEIEKLSANVSGNRKKRRRKVKRSSQTLEEVKFLLRHLPQTIQYLAKWLGVSYPYGECQFVFVSGLRGIYYAFSGLILLSSSLLCGSKVPESDIPMLARFAAVEGVLFGWIQDAIRLKGGGYRWIQLGMTSYLREKWGEKFYGSEEAQYRRWRSMKELIRLDQEIGSPCINPPDPDAYILDAMDPVVISFTAIKSEVLFNLLEARLGMPVLQPALQSLVKWLDDEMLRQPLDYPDFSPVMDADSTNNDKGKAADSTAGAASSELAPTEMVVETKETGNDSGARLNSDDACTRLQTWESELFRTGSSLLPIDNYQFFRNLKNEAMAAGEDTGTDLTESFVHRWVTGQGVAFFCCGCVYNSKKRQVEVVLEQVVPPWQEGYQSGGPLSVEIWEVEDCWKYSEHVEPAQQWSVVYSVHCKPRLRRKVERKTKSKLDAGEESKHKSDKVMLAATNGGRELGGAISGGGGVPTTTAINKPTLPSIQPLSDVHGDLHSESINDARDANATPILWAKVDPNMLWIRSISLQQPVYQWVEQLFCDAAVAGQADALLGLSELLFPPTGTPTAGSASVAAAQSSLVCKAMGDCLRGRVAHSMEVHSTSIRCYAAEALALWQNENAPVDTSVSISVPGSWLGVKALKLAFQERFMYEGTLYPNDFDSDISYRLKKALVWAIGSVKSKNGCTPSEVYGFVLKLLEENDNAENAYVDDYFIAQCLVALMQLCTVGESGLTSSEIKTAWEETQRWIMKDNLVDSHNEISFLFGDRGSPSTDYVSYADPSYSTSIRVAAVECVIRQYISEDCLTNPNGVENNVGKGLGSALLWTLKLIQSDPDRQVKEGCMSVLLDALDGRPRSAPFRARFQSDRVCDGRCDPWCNRDLWALSEEARSSSPSARGGISPAPVPNFEGAEEVVEILWDILTRDSAWNQYLRVLTLQLYESLWGFDVPPCLQNGKHPDLRGKGEWDRGDLDLAVSVRVQDWIIYRPTRREAPKRDWKQWRRAVASGHSFPQPDERGWTYGPANKEGILEQGKLQPLSAPKLIIRLPTIRPDAAVPPAPR